MLVPRGSYKYCSWESKWLLTWLTRAFLSSSFLDGKDSKNSVISLTGPNSLRVNIKIRSENKQTKTERKEKQ